MEIEIRPGPNGLEGGQPWPAVAALLKNVEKANFPTVKALKLLPRRMLARIIRPMMGSGNRDIARGVLVTERFHVAGPNGPVPVRSYRPEGLVSGLPVFVYYHGGGWLGGTVDVVENVCRAVADCAHCVALNVDYRLAPEHPFPAGLEDCRAVAEWAVAHAKKLGGDPSKVFLAGDSAGGNLATVCTLLAKEAKRPKYRGQVLLYAAVDLGPPVGGQGVSCSPLGDIAPKWYLNGDERLVDDPRVSPARAKDLSGLPAALVITAEFCFVRDQGETYAKKLAAAGVPVKAIRYNGMCHGFLDNVGLWPETDAIIEDVAAWIGETCR